MKFVPVRAVGAILAGTVLVSGAPVQGAVTRNSQMPVVVPAVAHFDYAGLVHVHSDYSADATGTYESLAETAAAQGLRFVIMTDHNTMRPLVDHRQGLIGHVLMLTGLESSRPEGHLLAIASPHAPVDQDLPTDAFLSAVTSDGGMVIVAHPFHRRWAWHGPIDPRMNGMEILDLADRFDAASLRSKVAAIAMMPFNRMGAYLSLGSHPTASLRLWDSIGQGRRFVGLYAPDLHQSIMVSSGHRIAFPPTAEIMRIARDHIVTGDPLQGDVESDTAVVYGALRAGHVFVALDVLADGTGFMFTAAQPGRVAWMGDEIAVGRTIYSVFLPPSAARLSPVIRLLRNGELIAESSPGDNALSAVDGRTGVFRVEVVTTASGPSKETTWIYSNPIYVRDVDTDK